MDPLELAPPLVLVPAAQAGVVDKRARFREIYCAVLEARRDLPDHRSCDEALTRVGNEAAGTGQPIDLGPSSRHLVAAIVPGLGFECFQKWLEPQGTAAMHVRQFGFEQVVVKVDALSGTGVNARQIRDALLAVPSEPGGCSIWSAESFQFVSGPLIVCQLSSTASSPRQKKSAPTGRSEAENTPLVSSAKLRRKVKVPLSDNPVALPSCPKQYTRPSA